MSLLRLDWAKTLKAEGELIGREGMSQRVIAAVEEFDGSYKGAMRLAGRLKAIAQMANADAYWSEQVDRGYHQERERRSQPMSRIPPGKIFAIGLLIVLSFAAIYGAGKLIGWIA